MIAFRHITMLLAAALFLGRSAAAAPLPPPDFNHDVRPILSGHCFKCHGPDDGQRMASLRFDLRTSATGALPSGHRAIVPGQPDRSMLVRRILSTGSDQMPPAYANKPLTTAEKQTLRRWVAAGADYQLHWAFVPPRQAPLPPVHHAGWSRNPIDRFILSRLEKAGLQPSPAADRYTLVRRVYLDLTGIPPTPEEADAFIHDSRPNAYELLVDRLLASPHYGELWARRWLDLARYADTNGFEKDRPRSVWPYRDWVIRAFNQDMPFNEFTIEQLAGDMLPHATQSQRIATGFHRNTMLNEEGGIDPQEYLFYSMVDRVATTGVTWLGLTVGCAQCHTHKFDPITHRDYYRLMAFFNNTEDRTIEVHSPAVDARRAELQRQIDLKVATLAERFPADASVRWLPPQPMQVSSAAGATSEPLPDGSVRLTGSNPDTDSYTVATPAVAGMIAAFRLETLTDPSLGHGGPGRTPHGNFVLSQFRATLVPASGAPIDVPLVRAEADFSQDGFPAAHALGGYEHGGWGIYSGGNFNVNRTITFFAQRPVEVPAGAHWRFRLDQRYGDHHTIGRFRISTAEAAAVQASTGQQVLQRKFAAWLASARTQATQWAVLRPTTATANVPRLTVQPDNSVFVSGDQSKRDVYTLNFAAVSNPITAVRLEVLPDDRLPAHGPGRVFYEGAPGDFWLSEITLNSGGKPAAWASADQDAGSPASAAIDGDPQSGWSINGHQGEASQAIFRLAKPVAAGPFSIQLVFERYHAADLGRFRISVTSDPGTPTAEFPPAVTAALRIPADQCTPGDTDLLLRHFLTIAPELQPARDEIAELKRQLPAYPTSLGFAERPADFVRPTYIHHRGEYLQTEAKVTPGIMAVLPPLPAGAPANRLTFARWVASPTNPLTARVCVNRQWAAFFGKGIVKTLQDFGYQGDPPTHPELLDWLAVEFMKEGWSLKKLHRLIVTSAAYRQSSRVTPLLLQKDPENRLISRGPRVRLEAELIRDAALQEAGLLSPRIGGPSVFPPQIPSITTEGTYGPLTWTVSQGQDRYRRGLYTFSKRTAPYAMFATFDAPSGEACVARRDVSNTPTQALTLLNNEVLVEASQALGKLAAAHPGTRQDRMVYLFRRCVTRPPTTDELQLMDRYFTTQLNRFQSRELDPARIVAPSDSAPNSQRSAQPNPGQPGPNPPNPNQPGSNPPGTNQPISNQSDLTQPDVNERAAWTVLARVLLNIDEAITKQ